MKGGVRSVIPMGGQIFRYGIGLLPELCITFHLHYISFALHLKILPRQHKMHGMSQFKCHALEVVWFFAFFQQLSPCQVAILQHL